MFPSLRDLKKLRERVGWSQNELAKIVGVSQSAITKYEAGSQIPSYEIAVKIFEALIDQEAQIDPHISELMTTSVITLEKNKLFEEAYKIIKNKSISQIPVTWKGQVVGTISDSSTLDYLEQYRNISRLNQEVIEDLMGEILPIVPRTARLKEVTPLLRHYGAILVGDREKLVGILTKADLLNITY